MTDFSWTITNIIVWFNSEQVDENNPTYNFKMAFCGGYPSKNKAAYSRIMPIRHSRFAIWASLPYADLPYGDDFIAYLT